MIIAQSWLVSKSLCDWPIHAQTEKYEVMQLSYLPVMCPHDMILNMKHQEETGQQWQKYSQEMKNSNSGKEESWNSAGLLKKYLAMELVKEVSLFSKMKSFKFSNKK